MKTQKICIIGDGLAGLTTAIALKKLNLNIDLFYRKNNKNSKKDKRTTSISNSNYKFIIKNINLKNKNYFWPCSKINLFYEDQNKYLNFLNYNNNKKNLMYIFENIKFIKQSINELKKSKNINLLNKSVEEVNYESSFIRFDNKKIYYDLIILCLGSKNNFYDSISENRSINKDYKEFAVTATI